MGEAGKSPLRAVTNLADPAWKRAPAFGFAAKQAQMTLCLNIMLDPAMRLQPQDQQKQHARACLERAEAILLHAPQMPVALLVSAAALSVFGESGAAEALRQAGALAPNEGWQAAARMQVIAVFDHWQEADADLRLLANSMKYLGDLAFYYIAFPSEQQRIRAALEETSQAQQDRFLRYLRVGMAPS